MNNPLDELKIEISNNLYAHCDMQRSDKSLNSLTWAYINQYSKLLEDNNFNEINWNNPHIAFGKEADPDKLRAQFKSATELKEYLSSQYQSFYFKTNITDNNGKCFDGFISISFTPAFNPEGLRPEERKENFIMKGLDEYYYKNLDKMEYAYEWIFDDEVEEESINALDYLDSFILLCDCTIYINNNFNVDNLTSKAKESFWKSIKEYLMQFPQLKNIIEKTIVDTPDFIVYSTSLASQQVRRFIYDKSNNNESEWYTRISEANKERFIIQLKPSKDILSKLTDDQIIRYKELMGSQIEQLGDLTVDVLDSIIYLWYIKDKDDSGFVKISVDDILFLRGLQQHLSGSGRRGGYNNEQRTKIVAEIELLTNIQITANQLVSSTENRNQRSIIESESSLIIAKRIIENHDDYLGVCKENPYYWLVKLGSVIQVKLKNENLQSGRLNRRILEYDPHRDMWEKRLGRYLLYLFRTRQKNSSYSDAIAVEKVLKNSGIDIDPKRPDRIRQRFEDALDKLQKDGVIAGYEYEKGFDEDRCIGRNWIKYWLLTKLIFEPSTEIIHHYAQNIRSFEKKPETNNNINLLRENLKSLMINLNMTLLMIEEDTGISSSALSRFLSNQSNINSNNRAKLERFITKRQEDS